MKSRLHSRSLTALAALMAAGGSISLGAQPPRPTRLPPRPDTPKMVVQIFGSADKVAGPAASSDLRDRLIRAYPSRTLYVVPNEEQFPMLEQSGFPRDQQLSLADEAALAKILRADDFIRGSVRREGAGFRVEASLVLTRDPSLSQPLPIKSGDRPDRAAAGLVDEIKEARKQLANERRCLDLARAEKLDEATKAADAAIVEYPKATIVRYCKLNVLYRKKAPQTQIIAMAEEILAIDPNSMNALQAAAEGYKAEGNVKKSNELYMQMVRLDPNNTVRAQQVVDLLAATGDWASAKEFVLKAIVDNPGDVSLIRLAFIVLSGAKDYKLSIQMGEEMVQMDTSLADATFFPRLAALYSADSQPQKAAEAYARATHKFPRNAQFWQFYAQALKNSGQVQQSIAASRRALEVDPKLPNGWTQIAVSYNELNFPDSALLALRSAKAAGDNAQNVGGMALTIGNRMYKAATGEGVVKTVPNLEMGLPYLHFADSTLTDPGNQASAKFLIGASSFYIAQTWATGLQASKSCEEARKGQAAIVNAQIYTQQGGRTSPQGAAQILTAAMELATYFETSIKAICK